MPSGLKAGQVFSRKCSVSHSTRDTLSTHTEKRVHTGEPSSGLYKGVDDSGRHLVQRLRGRDRGVQGRPHRVAEAQGSGGPAGLWAVGRPHEPACSPFSPACEASL